MKVTVRHLTLVILLGCILGLVANCAGGPRPELVPVDRETASEVASNLPEAPLEAAAVAPQTQTQFHPTEEDALALWSADNGLRYAGDCLINTVPADGALCGTDRGADVWTVGAGSNAPWFVVDIEQQPRGFRIASVHLAGTPSS